MSNPQMRKFKYSDEFGYEEGEDTVACTYPSFEAAEKALLKRVCER